jgi:hypothetical protein
MDLDDTILDIDDISKLLDFDASVGVSAPSTFVPPAAPAPPPLVTRRRPYKPVLGPNVYENEPVANAISSETVSERLREIQETKDAIAEASFTLYEDTIRSGSLFKRARVAARDSNALSTKRCLLHQSSLWSCPIRSQRVISCLVCKSLWSAIGLVCYQRKT